MNGALTGDDLLRAAVSGSEPFSDVVAAHIFKRYIALLYRLCMQERNEYDVLIGPGDSGGVMVYFAEQFYEIVGLPMPRKVLLPVQRFLNLSNESSGWYDNSLLLDTAAEQIGSQSFSRVLFVDDEIWKANSASACAGLVAKAALRMSYSERIVFTILAENHGFEWHYDIPPIAIQYYAFSKRISGVNNAVLRFYPSDEQDKLDRLVRPYMGQTQKLNLLLNGLVKVPSSGPHTPPTYGRLPAGLLRQPDEQFYQLRDRFRARHERLIHEAITEYKQGKIVFLF